MGRPGPGARVGPHVCNTPGPALEHVRIGAIRPLAVAGDGRSRYLPGVPSFKDAGIDLRLRPWIGMFAPAHTPREIVRLLNAETNKIIADPAFRAHYLVRQTIEPAGGTPGSFVAFLRRDRKSYAELVKMADIRPE